MEIFSQNLENEKNLVCVLCRAERMPRETATAKYLWQNESPGIIRSNTQTSKPETRVKDYLREAWGSSQSLGCSNGWKDDGIYHLTAMTWHT